MPKKKKYLGIPVASGRDKKATGEEIIGKVKWRLQGQKMKSLSQAGKVTLITLVASSIPSYQASSLILFSQICPKLDALNRKFWWGSKEENKHGYCLKSWNSICTPKDVGGLGIKKMADMNKALVEKMTRDVVKGVNKMWVNIFRKKYVRNRNFMKMPTSRGGSWASQSIFQCREVIKKGMCHRISNGLNTQILEDPWVPNEPEFIPKVRSGISMDVHLVADLIDRDTRQWDRGKLSNLFEPSSVTNILNIHLPIHIQQDQIY